MCSPSFYDACLVEYTRQEFDYTNPLATGCSGPMAARMAILKAARQLAVEANVHVHIRKFQVINQARTRPTRIAIITPLLYLNAS